MSAKSLQAFQELLQDDKRTSQQKEILLFIKKFQEKYIVNYVLSLKVLWFNFSEYRQSAISARLSELHSFGMIKFVQDPVHTQSIIVYVSDENEREQIRKQVAAEKRQKWLKAGLKNGYLMESEGKIELSFNITI